MLRFCAILALLASAAGCGTVRRLDETVTRQSGEIAAMDYRISELQSLVGKAERSSAGTFEEILSVREVYGGASPDSAAAGRPVVKETVRRRRSVTSSSETESVSGAAVSEASSAESAAVSGREEKSVSAPADGGPRGGRRKTGRLLTRLGLSAAAILLAALAVRAAARHPGGIRRLFKGLFKTNEN